MAATMTTSGATLIKAGAGVSTVIAETGAIGVSAEDIINQFINEAESVVNVAARYNFTDNYAALNADVKHILNETVSDLAAIYAIQYDMSGYTSRVEAEDMVNILRDGYLRGLSQLKDKKAQDFMIGES